MALSQIQCLDEHHVNWRVSEGKPGFFYSEAQRLALEALISSGRDAFREHLREHAVRGFLSDPELERLARTAEAYRPGSEHQVQQPVVEKQQQKTEAAGGGAPTTPGTPTTTTPGTPTTPGGGNAADDGDGPVSLQYWPDRSEASVAELDLGWPEASSYRGVTRVTVHTQPPTEGGSHTHIKEVVRKSIANAQRVIAVVMDAFTDVDIFRDLLDASYKRRVPVYIILDTAAVPCFLSMCGRADMHRGHLKNLRVRSCGGVEFCTRSAVKVRGSMSQRFLLVDGDKAISGSYSFTWSSSRLDRNLITVVTGQASETFDQQFRDLYLTSRGVSLSKVSVVDEPILDPVPQAAPTPVPASIARKFINPKYALVTSGNHASTTSSDRNSSNKNPAGLKFPKERVKEREKAPPLHPGLDLEKAYLIPYLPTWPDPDPPKDVIGFINIRDEKRAFQVHLQRSERFDVSQAIRFSSPFTAPTPSDKNTPEEGSAHPAGTDTSENTGTAASVPLAQSNTQPTQQQQHTDSSDIEHTAERDSSRPSQQPSTSQAEDTPHKPDPHASKPQDKDTSTSQPRDTAKQAPETLAADHPPAPPIPKPRTLQLVIDSGPSEQSGQPPQVTLIKKDQSDTTPVQTQEGENATHGRVRGLSEEDAKDEGSVDEGSLDSTKVMCDRTANDNPSSEEEFYDCSQSDSSEPLASGDPLASSDPLANGVTTTGSGRAHRALGDGVNLMARLSQSMVDLRDPQQSEDSNALLLEARQLRQRSHPSPHRHIGQLFQSSGRSPGRDGKTRGPKVVIAKPGSYHRPTRASGPVIGGHRYWLGQTQQPDTGQLPRDARAGRSPRRHSPGDRRTGHASSQPPANQTGVMGVSFSKLANLKHLKSRALVGGPQKKAPQSKKDTS